MIKNYYFVIASQDFLIREEPIEEILRERMNHYNKYNRKIDFWLMLDPFFLNADTMKDIKSNLKKPSAAIVSLDSKFIDWLKLRLGYVMIGSFQSVSIER